MKITALVENISYGELKAKHGLSLYIESKKHKILFDVGSDTTLFKNAQIKGVDLSSIDIVIISHGHIDHGGALKDFLRINTSAKIYIQRKAFISHYNKLGFLKINIGLNKELEDHSQIILVDGDFQIDDELSLFTVSDKRKCHSNVNDALYMSNKKDDFTHEQNLIISEKQVALIMGCGHAGVVNIMNKAITYNPMTCVGGYHFFNPITRRSVPVTLLDEVVQKLKSYPQVKFYTCHCTGRKSFLYLSKQLPNMNYLSCGESIIID